MGPLDPTMKAARNSNSSSDEGTAIPPFTPHDEKKQQPFAAGSAEDGIYESKGAVIEKKSKGVVEMESLKERVNVKFLCILYGFFALLAYVLSLSTLFSVCGFKSDADFDCRVDQATSGTFLTQAVSVAFEKHALQATVGTITAVFQVTVPV